MRINLLAIAFAASFALPSATLAGQTTHAGPLISSAQLRDTTYTARVVNVPDAKHVTVAFSNGSRATLVAGRPTVNFSTVHQGDSIMFSTHNGAVLVFKDLSASGQGAPAPASTP
jgi:hypothetical protein